MKAKIVTIVLFLSILLFISDENHGCLPPGPYPVAIMIVRPGYKASGNTAYLIVNKMGTFDASGSYDLQGSITKYEWDFDGELPYDYWETASDCIDGKFDGVATYSYPNIGDSYTITLRVTDNDGYTTTATVYVNVSSDSDSDDLANGWEISYWGNTDHNAENDDDSYPHGDGYNNLSEYIHGTNPTDNTSRPITAITLYVPQYTGTLDRAINASIDGLRNFISVNFLIV